MAKQHPCKVCHFDLLTAAAYEAHLNTTLHLRKQALCDLLNSDAASIDESGLQSQYAHSLRQYEQKIFGEDNISEFRLKSSPDKAHFWACGCCYAYGKTVTTLQDHLLADRHTLLCIKNFCPNEWPKWEQQIAEKKDSSKCLKILLEAFCAEKRERVSFADPEIFILDDKDEPSLKLVESLGLCDDELDDYEFLGKDVLIRLGQAVDDTDQKKSLHLVNSGCGLLTFKCQICYLELVYVNSKANLEEYLDFHRISKDHAAALKFRLPQNAIFNDLEGCIINKKLTLENRDLDLHFVLEFRQLKCKFKSGEGGDAPILKSMLCTVCLATFSVTNCLVHLRSQEHKDALMHWFKSEYMDTIGSIESVNERDKLKSILYQQIVNEYGRGEVAVAFPDLRKLITSFGPLLCDEMIVANVLSNIVESGSHPAKTDMNLESLGVGHQFVPEIRTSGGEHRPTYFCRVCRHWLYYMNITDHMKKMTHTVLYYRLMHSGLDEDKGTFQRKLKKMRQQEKGKYGSMQLDYVVDIDDLKRIFPAAVIPTPDACRYADKTGCDDTAKIGDDDNEIECLSEHKKPVDFVIDLTKSSTTASVSTPKAPPTPKPKIPSLFEFIPRTGFMGPASRFRFRPPGVPEALRFAGGHAPFHAPSFPPIRSLFPPRPVRPPYLRHEDIPSSSGSPSFPLERMQIGEDPHPLVKTKPIVARSQYLQQRGVRVRKRKKGKEEKQKATRWNKQSEPNVSPQKPSVPPTRSTDPQWDKKCEMFLAKIASTPSKDSTKPKDRYQETSPDRKRPKVGEDSAPIFMNDNEGMNPKTLHKFKAVGSVSAGEMARPRNRESERDARFWDEMEESEKRHSYEKHHSEIVHDARLTKHGYEPLRKDRERPRKRSREKSIEIIEDERVYEKPKEWVYGRREDYFAEDGRRRDVYRGDHDRASSSRSTRETHDRSRAPGWKPDALSNLLADLVEREKERQKEKQPFVAQFTDSYSNQAPTMAQTYTSTQTAFTPAAARQSVHTPTPAVRSRPQVPEDPIKRVVDYGHHTATSHPPDPPAANQPNDTNLQLAGLLAQLLQAQVPSLNLR